MTSIDITGWRHVGVDAERNPNLTSATTPAECIACLAVITIEIDGQANQPSMAAISNHLTNRSYCQGPKKKSHRLELFSNYIFKIQIEQGNLVL